jgi:acetyltransferase-like isoleucine patch superfamily enzyme
MGYNHLLSKGDFTNIEIGDDCLLSYGIEIRTTDSHSIFDQESGSLLNPPRSISIGNHVWVGARSMILKGASIGSGTVIGAYSIVNKAVGANVIAAGQPCKELKSFIRWDSATPQSPKHETPSH